jgi:hypothetical protein
LWEYLQQDTWWQAQFAGTRTRYQEWIANGRVDIQVGDIEVPGWNLHNQTTLILHYEDRVDQTYELIQQFIQSQFDDVCVDQLVAFQKATVVYHGSLAQLPLYQSFDWDFWGYLVHNTELNRAAQYRFDTAEDKAMSPRMFLEKFYFGRKRNFGKAQITQVM